MTPELITLDTATLAFDAGVATITLNRPDSLNALSFRSLEDLHTALRTVMTREGTRALVLTGQGRGFCAGADQRASMPSPPNDPERLIRDYFNPTLGLLNEIGIPTVAAVNGVAAGAGMSLALSCDFVVAARSAYFIAAFVNQGLVPDTGASWWLTQALGVPRANAILMLNDKLPASQAESWGLIHRCVDDAELQAEARALAMRLAEGPTLALAMTRRLTRGAVKSTLHEQMHAELQFQSVARATEDRTEARQAFAEKRKPQFKGR